MRALLLGLFVFKLELEAVRRVPLSPQEITMDGCHVAIPSQTPNSVFPFAHLDPFIKQSVVMYLDISCGCCFKRRVFLTGTSGPFTP